MRRITKPLLYMVILTFIAVVIIIIHKRSSIYSYDVSKDYSYTFKNTNATITDLSLIDGKIRLPQLDENHSAFLRLNVNTTIPGKIFQPSIDINTGKSSITQYFEYGAKGVRFINLSSLINKNQTNIRLVGKFVSIDDQTVQLATFNNRNIKNQKILVLAPHPDDAEAAAFGLYSDNKKSYIITVTAGEAGGYKYDEIYANIVQHYLKKGELRTYNSIVVPLLGGILPEQAINLGFFDSTLKKMFDDKSKSVSGIYTNISDINTFRKLNISTLGDGLSGESTWNSLVENLCYLLAEIKPDILVAPYPALDKHPDHKYSTLALFEAIKKSNIQDGYLYLYSNHFVLNEYYPYGKEGGAKSLPPNFEDKIYFDSIYSHPLSSDKQKDKIFALEAMNDLRPDTEWRFFSGNLKNLYRVSVQKILGREKNFFRNSIRSNELFFIVKISNIYDETITNRLLGKM